MLLLGEFELTCYTLSNNVKVFSHVRILNLMMLEHTNINLGKQLSALRPFLPLLFIERKIRLSIVFTRNDIRMRGIAYEDFTTLCKAIVLASMDNKLAPAFFIMVHISTLFLSTLETSAQVQQ